MSINISKRAANILPSPTIAISTKAKEMAAKGIDVINFGVGEPDFNTPDYIKESAKLAIDQNFTRYTPNAGILELRAAICAKLKKDNNLDYTPNDILVSAGAKSSLIHIILATCEAGDEVIVPVPYWVSYPPMVEMAGAKCCYLQTAEENDFKITPELLKETVKDNTKIKAIILNSPSNPTGMVYTKEELKAIADICVEHNILIISDEIYEKLVYGDTEFISIASLSPEIKNITVVVNGVSKAYAMTGWRLGYCAGPTDLIKAAGRVQEHTTSNVNSITQKATVTALTQDDGSLEMMHAEFEKRRIFLVNELNKIENVTCRMPMGAFYAFPNVSYYLENNNKGIKDTNDLCNYLLDNYHIALVSGISFGDDRFVRFSYANSMENLIEGARRFRDGLLSLV